MNNLNDAAEAAFVTFLTPVAGGPMSGQYSVFAGKDGSDKDAPCIIVASDGEDNDEEPFHSGNYWLNISVFIKSQAATDLDAQGDPVASKPPDVAMVDAIFAALQVEGLDALVNTDDFFIFPNAYFFGSPKCGRDEAGIWISELPMRVYCCGRNLNPAPV